MKRNNFETIIFVALFIFSLDLLSAESRFTERAKSNNSYGTVGLIEIPSARFRDDGDFGFGISSENPFNRIYSKVQILPWMEASVRYTEGEHREYTPANPQTWKDKGFDIKLKVLNERKYLPALALGFTDFGGTGAYSSEFLVASKMIGENLDVTMGIGWGKLGSSDNIPNPLGIIAERYKVRGAERGYLGGTLNIGALFTGPASLFGGIEYFTPIENLSMKVEYDSNSYEDIIGFAWKINEPDCCIGIDSKFNYGLNYRIDSLQNDVIDLSLGYVRGNTIQASIAIHTNLNQKAKPKFIAPKEIINVPYLQPFEKLKPSYQEYLSKLIMWQMGNEGFVPHAVIFNGDELQVEISQSRFRETGRAFDLASRILASNSPINIEKITVINIDQGIETVRSTIQRDVLVEAVLDGPLNEELLSFNEYSNDQNAIYKENPVLYPTYYWQLTPNLSGTLQHQERFYFWQLEALLHTEISFAKGFYLTTNYAVKVKNNFERYDYHVPDGKLYHVRQNRRLYLTEGESGLRRMAFDYLLDLGPSVKAKFSAGLLEWMYGGVAGEVIYLPYDGNWAIGLDAAWVKQRDFDQRFDFLDYETVTGFLSLYYDLPFYNLRFKAKYGKFLAEDVGYMVDVSRRFENGSSVGAAFARTDCDAECVGEGSFNKWIYFTLPMDLFYQKSTTRKKSGFSWSPLTKDAGQRVEATQLYAVVSNARDSIKPVNRRELSIKKIFAGFSTQSKSIEK
tara:strand:+ start:169 stop:2379 length:2211 start_codon:yes stop_codon:yes gene_type:complete